MWGQRKRKGSSHAPGKWGLRSRLIVLSGFFLSAHLSSFTILVSIPSSALSLLKSRENILFLFHSYNTYSLSLILL